MLFTTLLSLVSLLAASSAAPIVVRQAKCNDYVIINTRGTGEIQGPSSGFRSMTATTLKNVPNGSTRNTVYPASFSQNSASGTADIINFMQKTLASCPDTKFALLGYSQGAAATTDALKKIQPTDATGKAIAAVFMIGNPQRKPGKAANVNENGSTTANANANGISSRIPGAGIPAVWDATGKVMDECFTGDGVCSGFSINAPHLAYPTDKGTQDLGAKFLTSKLQ